MARKHPRAQARFPAEVTSKDVGVFDLIAERMHRLVSSAAYFYTTAAAILGGVLLGFPMMWSDLWYRLTVIPIAIFTFLMIALLENADRRATLALQHRLNAQSLALLELLGDKASPRVLNELRESISVEEYESAEGMQE